MPDEQQAIRRPDAGSIPEREWIWDGHAGHLIVSDDCIFHLSTRVGDYRISTVGEWVPNSQRQTNGRALGGEEYARFEGVGAGSLFETFVFRASGPGFGTVDAWSEIDAESANDHDTATSNHMAMCRKYARR